MASEFKVGDKVTTNAQKDINGTSLQAFVRTNTYTITQINGTAALLSSGTTPVAWVPIPTLTKQSGSKKSNKDKEKSNKDKGKSPNTDKAKNQNKLSEGIDSGLQNLIKAGNNAEILKYNMRLFGLPHQFTKYCDYRTYSVSGKPKNQLVGRKFIENIMLEAPVLTMIPGKPKYLPNSKNKRGTTYNLLQAATDNVSVVVAAEDIKNNNKTNFKKLKYYDFEQDFTTYARYVDLMCSLAASFLELDDETLDGVQLPAYEWRNYRWNHDSYKSSAGSLLGESVSAAKSFVNKLKSAGKQLWKNVTGFLNGTSKKDANKSVKKDTALINKLKAEGDGSLIGALEDVLTQMNFVQFYVDASGGMSESADNTTGESQLSSMMTSGQEMAKEIGFLANSGGIKTQELNKYVKGGVAEFTDRLSGGGTISGILRRALGGVGSIIKGENMIFPEIYQSSKYTRSYSIVVDLRAVYGNKLSYFLDVLVPLCHLMGFVLPKQTTANTYGSPFLIKAFIPGQMTCNLGIVTSMSIERNSSSDSWTVDGYPNSIRCTLNITDLYSDLTMTPTGVNSLLLFINNSSLIEFIATSCGVNLVTPQLKNRVNFATNIAKIGIDELKPSNVAQNILSSVDDVISGLLRV